MPDYKVISDDTIPTYKRTVLVELEARVSPQILRKISDEIRAEQKSETGRTFINFDLRGKKEPGFAHWAVARYEPEFRLRVNGDD